MDFLKLIACALIAYLLGSLSFGIIVTKLLTGDDIRNHGSGNAGSTNAYRVLGAKALFVVAGDVLKGIAAMLIGRAIAGADGQVCAYMFVLFGHAYPIFFGLRGGKGVLTTVASLAMLSVPAAAMFGVVFFIVFFLTRFVSLSSMIAAATIPLFLYLYIPLGS